MRFHTLVAVATAAAALLLASTAMAHDLSELASQAMFADFVTTFTKAYPTTEFFSRYNTFKANLAYITAHNERAKGKSPTALTLKMNEFGDLSNAEFKSLMRLRPVSHRLNRARALAAEADARPTPFRRGLGSRVASGARAAAAAAAGDEKGKDWREEGAVGPIKNQGMCGSCWAFSALASVEAAHAIKTGTYTELSEQQLVSCDKATGNEGCNGGFMDKAFEYLIENGGACSAADYPYASGGGASAGKDGECQPCAAVAKPRTYTSVPENDEAALLAAVDRGVVAVAVHAGSPKFQFAGTGILDAADCGDELDHGVAIVGYGSEAGVPYWIVRNSWGESWADGGYVRIKRGVGTKGVCGINMMPSIIEM